MDTLEVTSKPLVKMSRAKKKILEAKGYKVTDSAEWLGLSREEAQIVDMRVALAQELERFRKAKGITQAELARRVGTKQSGVARMLNNPDTSTMDNLIKALIALGEPISKIAACLLLCGNLWIHLRNGAAEGLRNQIVSEAMERGEREITLPGYPYPDYIHGAGSVGALSSHYYYDVYGDISFRFVTYRQWIESR